MYGPAGIMNHIRDTAEAAITGWTIDNCNWGKLFSCDEMDNMPDFDILFGNYWMKVFAEDYVVPVNRSGTCSICLFGNDNNYWLLGASFLRGWYSIHDHAQGRMGFVPYSGSAKTKPDASTGTPTIASPESRSGSSESSCNDPSALNVYDFITWAFGSVILIVSAVAWCKIPRHNGK